MDRLVDGFIWATGALVWAGVAAWGLWIAVVAGVHLVRARHGHPQLAHPVPPAVRQDWDRDW